MSRGRSTTTVRLVFADQVGGSAPVPWWSLCIAISWCSMVFGCGTRPGIAAQVAASSPPLAATTDDGGVETGADRSRLATVTPFWLDDFDDGPSIVPKAPLETFAAGLRDAHRLPGRPIVEPARAPSTEESRAYVRGRAALVDGRAN